jgi:hypothetical protein
VGKLVSIVPLWTLLYSLVFHAADGVLAVGGPKTGGFRPGSR